jgi:hypothetical protein
VFEKGLNALGIPDLFSIAAARRSFVACSDRAEIHGNATYVLYLLCDTIWTWEFSHRERRNGTSASTASRSTRQRRREQRRRGNRHRRPQFGIVPEHRNAGARLKLDPALGRTAARSCC